MTGVQTCALPISPLDALLAAGVEVALVVTRPDVRRGRGSATTPSPVKARALARGIPVTSDVRDVLGLADAGPIAGVVVAFGERIPDEVLARVPMLNLHFSLLPRWRGAAPVERAILAGDAETGACVMSVVPEMDAGPVHASASTAIGPGDTTESLRARLLALGVPLLDAAVRDADVVMLLRIQLERMEGAFFPSLREYFNVFGMTESRLRYAKPDVMIMHPGPMNRGVEIASEVADGPYSVILDQVANGVAVRMAVLYLLAGGAEHEEAA